MTDRDELEAIVRAFVRHFDRMPPLEEVRMRGHHARTQCALCHREVLGWLAQHESDCAWRRACEWVQRNGGERG